MRGARLAACALLLTGCGLKGELFLPPPTDAPEVTVPEGIPSASTESGAPGDAYDDSPLERRPEQDIVDGTDVY